MVLDGCPRALRPVGWRLGDRIDGRRGAGRGPRRRIRQAIRPFEVDVPEPVLADLRERLRGTRYPDEIPGSDWGYGTNLAYLKELVGYWTDEFDWRAQERRINGFDHFKTVIDGLDIHFIHQRSPVEDATPLLISHGWPGSFLEFMKVIGPLTDPVAHGGRAGDAFHVVVPSIPGFGFSDKPAAARVWTGADGRTSSPS